MVWVMDLGRECGWTGGGLVILGLKRTAPSALGAQWRPGLRLEDGVEGPLSLGNSNKTAPWIEEM